MCRQKLSKQATKQRKEIHKCTYNVAYKTEREREKDKRTRIEKFVKEWAGTKQRQQIAGKKRKFNICEYKQMRASLDDKT